MIDITFAFDSGYSWHKKITPLIAYYTISGVLSNREPSPVLKTRREKRGSCHCETCWKQGVAISSIYAYIRTN